MRISDWSSDVCPSDLPQGVIQLHTLCAAGQRDHALGRRPPARPCARRRARALAGRHLGARRAGHYGGGHLALDRRMKQDEQMSDLALRLLGCAYDELDAAEQRVIRAIAERAPTSRDAAGDDEVTTRPGLGPRLADKVAAVGGSWGFIIGFSLVLFAWMLINSKALEHLGLRSEEHTSELQSLMRISYAVFCLKKKK